MVNLCLQTPPCDLPPQLTGGLTGATSRGAKQGLRVKLLTAMQGEGRSGVLEGCAGPKGRPGTLRSRSAEQGTDGQDGKSGEAVGAARARERDGRADGRCHRGW